MCALGVCRNADLPKQLLGAKSSGSVMSVKGKKVLHIDRNDHYGGYASCLFDAAQRLNAWKGVGLNQHRICMV